MFKTNCDNTNQNLGAQKYSRELPRMAPVATGINSRFLKHSRSGMVCIFRGLRGLRNPMQQIRKKTTVCLFLLTILSTHMLTMLTSW